MFKKFMSLMLALMIVMSVAVIGFSADELTGDGIIYFDAASAGWKDAASILFYTYEIDGEKIGSWGSTKTFGGTKVDGDIWGFDAAKLGVTEGKQYGIIFHNPMGGQTYDLLLDTTCFGDTAYANPDVKIENPVDSSQKTMEARWKNTGYGPIMQITSIGSLVGDTVPSNTSKYQMFVNFLASKEASSLTNALNYNGKDVQTSIDDTAAALGLSKSEVADAIKEAATKGCSNNDDKTDWTGQWSEDASSLSGGSSGGSGSESSGSDTSSNASNDTDNSNDSNGTDTTSGSNGSSDSNASNNGSTGSANSGSTGGSNSGSTGGSSNSGSADSSQTGQEETVLFIMLGVMVAAAGVIFFARKRESA